MSENPTLVFRARNSACELLLGRGKCAQKPQKEGGESCKWSQGDANCCHFLSSSWLQGGLTRLLLENEADFPSRSNISCAHPVATPCNAAGACSEIKRIFLSPLFALRARIGRVAVSAAVSVSNSHCLDGVDDDDDDE